MASPAREDRKMILIVPNVLRDAINTKLDLALQKNPEATIAREELYKQMLVFFDENGYVPDISIVKKENIDGNRQTDPKMEGK